MRVIKDKSLFSAASIVLAIAIFSCSQPAATSLLNTGPDGLAVKGYDTVAYFTEGMPVKGSPEFEYEWMGSRWRFSSAENMEMFRQAPEKYAPQYGGY